MLGRTGVSLESEGFVKASTLTTAGKENFDVGNYIDDCGESSAAGGKLLSIFWITFLHLAKY